MTFSVGDRVRIDSQGTGGNGSIDGTVIGFDSSGCLVHVKRDDGKEGTGINDSWQCFPRNLTVIEDCFVAVDKSVSEDKGYVPDGFDAEAHRSFMKTLGR